MTFILKIKESMRYKYMVSNERRLDFDLLLGIAPSEIGADDDRWDQGSSLCLP
jgi:hypothetical protein